MSVVVFDNAGEIDPRLISTFGVNVKEGAGAIGFFGTGLKYGLAILLRSGHSVTIQSGETVHTFALQPAEIRGKTFDFIAMDGQPLGFTAEVGKTWKMWMAYRELFCNCQDEGGDAYESDQAPEPMAGRTRVIVEGDEFAAVRREHGRYFIESAPIYKTADGDLHAGPAHGLHYRSVLVGCSGSGKPMLYGYNFRSPITLTEDRTIMRPLEAECRIARMILRCDNPDIIRAVVTARDCWHEHGLDLDWPSTEPSETFLSVVGDLIRKDFAVINRTARDVYERCCQTKAEPEPFALDDFQRLMLDRATAFCCRFGFSVEDYEVETVDNIGPGVLGMARNGKIYVTRQAFELGTKQLAATLIEEFIHLRHGVDDCTRGMQEHLLNRLVTFGERLQGQPL